MLTPSDIYAMIITRKQRRAIVPEFVLIIGGPASERIYNTLDDFTRGYVQAMFFTEREAASMPKLISFSMLTHGALQIIQNECRAFQTRNAIALNQSYEAENYDAEQAGRDFWFTRNRYGVGFWDRPLPRVVSKTLTDASHKFGERYLFIDDFGKLYVG